MSAPEEGGVNRPGGRRHTVPIDVHLLAVRDGAGGRPEVLLSRRAGDVYAAGLWHLPSGHVDGPFEALDTALIRETAEETGLVVAPADVRAAVTVHHRAPSGGARIGVLFEVRRWAGTPRIMEADVCDGMDWFAFDALPEPMVAYCRAGLDAYLAGAAMALHLQEPGDPIRHDPSVDRLRLVHASVADGGRGPDAEVRAFAERAVGRITDWSDASWARDASRVWRAVGRDGGVWFVKVHQNARFHARETAALRGWVPGLGGAAPRLVAADPALNAVVVTAVEGRPLHGAVLAAAEERSVFRAIGALAARIHASPPPAALPATLPVALRADAFGKLERHLRAARPHLAPGDEEHVRAVVEGARRLAPLPPVVTHGDLQPRNLLLAGDGTLRVLDFERSEPQPVVRDMARLLDHFEGRDDLADAFFAGYGRPLDDLEQAHLAPAAVLDAVSGIAYGHAAGDPELVERGRRTLLRSRAGTLLPPRPSALAAPDATRTRTRS
ncbi:phosphotransferase [Streptomyces sp. NPDC007325]|uniref:phosphotransferase n=1 Tax=Streptomyces sp. NPDC007325 TaxID=3154588 RepID=UPI0033F83726